MKDKLKELLSKTSIPALRKSSQ